MSNQNLTGLVWNYQLMMAAIFTESDYAGTKVTITMDPNETVMVRNLDDYGVSNNIHSYICGKNVSFWFCNYNETHG